MTPFRSRYTFRLFSYLSSSAWSNLEIILLGLLKFDDKLLAGFVFAIDVVNGLAVCVGYAELLRVFERQVSNLTAWRQQRIQEIHEQGFARFLAKDFLESKVRKWVDEFGLH